MAGLIDAKGNPLNKNDITRRKMKSGQIKQTKYGDVIIRLYVDLPDKVSEDEFKAIMREYGGILREAFK